MKMKFYRCSICGNIVELVNDGGGELVCCGQPMDELIAKIEDEGMEKHLPIVSREADKIMVSVGSTLHPMIDAHYINWIIIKYNNKLQKKYLKPGDEPKAIFTIDEEINKIEVYEYCNIHGLWKTNTYTNIMR